MSELSFAHHSFKKSTHLKYNLYPAKPSSTFLDKLFANNSIRKLSLLNSKENHRDKVTAYYGSNQYYIP